MSFEFEINADPERLENRDYAPIHSFNGLKGLLKSMGYNIGKAKGYKPIDIQDVTLEEIKNGTIEFADDGIFVNSRGISTQVFLYKRSFHLARYGKPRFHIRKCKVIESFMHADNTIPEYSRANTATVWVKDMDDRFKDKEVSDLPLCKFCIEMISKDCQLRSSSEFVEILKEAGDVVSEENIEVDIFGYTKDWEMISKAYREMRGYTCEKCGCHISDPFDQQYMHTHHINAHKADNRLPNLQCLCIRCHAAVDEYHKVRFSSGVNKILLDEFNRKYPPKTIQ